MMRAWLSVAILNVLKITPVPVQGKSVVIAIIEIGGQKIELSAPTGEVEDGSEDHLYTLGSASSLLALQKSVAEGLDTTGIHYKQITDIDLSGIPWTGIGGHKGATLFKGIYDGNNKSIYNIIFFKARC